MTSAAIRGRRMRWGCAAATFLTILAVTRSGLGFINPKFTPKHAFEQSGTVLVLEFGKVGKDGKVTAVVKEVLKSEPNRPAPKEFQIDLLAMGELLAAQGKEIIALIEGGVAKQGILFSGKFKVDDNEDPAEQESVRHFVQLGGKWIIISADKTGTLGMDRIWEFLLGTWSGSTDQLLRCLRYVKADPDATVPCREEVSWDCERLCSPGKIAGKVGGVFAADVAGKGRADLYAASEDGDKLYRWEGNHMVDITEKVGLTSKSRLFAWGDFNGDGRVDLASWEEDKRTKRLILYLQTKDGTFAAGPAMQWGGLPSGAVSMTALDVGGGKAGLVQGTSGGAILFVPGADGKLSDALLDLGKAPLAELRGDTGGGQCLVADLDDDGIVDILQVFEKGSLFYKGSAPGKFAPAVRCGVAGGKMPFTACLGDFDNDGLLDVFIAGDERSGLWQNLGKAGFVNMLEYCGSLSYISKGGGVATCMGDINGDGRQDLFIAYSGAVKMVPQMFFNRGFRCFGHARDLDLMMQKSSFDGNFAEAAGEGQQAGCLGDFDGDGAPDMAMVLVDGTVFVLPRKIAPAVGAIAAVASMPFGAAGAGPLNVKAFREDRLLGTWVLRAGEGPQPIGGETAGNMTLRWRWPDGKAGEKKVKVRQPTAVTVGKD